MNIFKTAIGAILILWMGSCDKEDEVALPSATASLTLIHAVVDGGQLRTNFRGTASILYQYSNKLDYGRFSSRYNRYAVPAGPCPLGLFEYPDTLADSQPLFLFDLDLSKGSIHTLFLTGTVDAPESVLVKDEVPFYTAGDSTMGIRFINLSPGSAPISVNLVDRESGSEVAELAYKEITGFKRYAVKKDVADYIFEFRLAETDELIASYETKGIGNDGVLKQNDWLYRNYTLALIGQSNAFKLLLVSHFDD